MRILIEKLVALWQAVNSWDVSFGDQQVEVAEEKPVRQFERRRNSSSKSKAKKRW